MYSDVSPTSNYAQSINYVTQENIMSGVGNGKFAPKKNVQRAMITQILYNYSGRPTINYYRKFSDVKSNSWYANSVIWASSNNIVNGYNNKFSPNNNITLEQVITILYNFAQSKGLNVNVGYTQLQEYNVDIQKMSSYAKTPMEWAAANGIINTYEPGKIVPKKKINREGLSMIFQNYMRYLQNGE
ncbi:MAG: S-layer homology domain-containing protein [Peptoanaerobacter stomatis]|uniref:S-layer homology domain-containing protein n=1 Tax=Peptoanaerobacter stomatis TaxID=796937 RepID=UPI003F9F1F99